MPDLCGGLSLYQESELIIHASGPHRDGLHDPTGISDRMLVSLQKLFYPGPDPSKYYIPSFGGENASYREPPWWLRTEDFIEI